MLEERMLNEFETSICDSDLLWGGHEVGNKEKAAFIKLS